ncbi:copper-binding protein [Hydrogenophaga sp. 2FB]|uniref:copper-binding protein n=1 Tax=Hydrogenophaga sp. 2FB TaxID=2502187 RepID=UPI0010F7F071|nr:copper-binding protein [Hydrogenophaga sp. 2FB]
MQRRHLLSTAIGLSLAATGAFAQAALPPLQVWKDPNCGCCADWVALMRADGFQVQVFDSGNTAVRQRLGLPAKYASCHTGLVGGYAIEGHVAPGEIRRLLAEKPDAIGLAVPGMPVGSPGMDGPVYGERRDAYDVLLVQRDGSSRVFQHHAGALKKTSTDGAPALPTTDAEVRKVDTAAGKITLKHGEIRNLDMPPMTMVFQVSDPALLSKVKAGDKVRVMVDKVNGAFTVMALEPAP